MQTHSTDTPHTSQLPDGLGEVTVVPEDFGSQRFRIDADGKWYHDGVCIERSELVRMLAPHVRRESDGQHMLHWGPRAHPIAVADTAAVVHAVGAPNAATGTCDVSLVDGRDAAIALDGIYSGRDNVLYATIVDGDIARFDRQAYYQFSQWIEETDGGFAVVAGDRQWPIGCST